MDTTSKANALSQGPVEYHAARWQEIQESLSEEQVQLLGFHQKGASDLHSVAIYEQYSRDRLAGVEMIARALLAHYQAALSVLERFYPIDRIAEAVADQVKLDDGEAQPVIVDRLSDPLWIAEVIERGHALVEQAEKQEAIDGAPQG